MQANTLIHQLEPNAKTIAEEIVASWGIPKHAKHGCSMAFQLHYTWKSWKYTYVFSYKSTCIGCQGIFAMFFCCDPEESWEVVDLSGLDGGDHDVPTPLWSCYWWRAWFRSTSGWTEFGPNSYGSLPNFAKICRTKSDSSCNMLQLHQRLFFRRPRTLPISSGNWSWEVAMRSGAWRRSWITCRRWAAMDVKFRPHQDVEFQQMVFILLSSLYDVI